MKKHFIVKNTYLKKRKIVASNELLRELLKLVVHMVNLTTSVLKYSETF